MIRPGCRQGSRPRLTTKGRGTGISLSGRIKLTTFGDPLDGPPPMAQPAPCGTLSNSGGIVKQAVQKATNPIDKHVGGRVRMRRMMLGMSQSTLGDGLERVQKYEKGTNRMGASRLQHISHILQVPVPFFFEAHHTCRASPRETERRRRPPMCPNSSPRPTGSRSPRHSCG
jgi:hypothetical protein